MNCPKCQSTSVFDALEEAPLGVKAWKRCVPCGKRWDPTTIAQVTAGVDTIKRAFEEWPEDDERPALRDDDDDEDGDAPDPDLLTGCADDLEEDEETPADRQRLAMQDIRVRRERPAKETRMKKAPEAQPEITCTRPGCKNPPREGRAWCDHHCDQQEKYEKNAKAKAAGPVATTPAKRGRKPKDKSAPALSGLPAVADQTERPIVAHVIDAVPASRSVFAAIDQALAELDSDRATLERTKQILERMQA